MRLIRMLGVLWLASGALAAPKSEPEITVTEFENQPRALFLFEDSETALSLDFEKQVIFRSTNAGATWQKVDEIKATIGIHPHPNDNKVAVVLGEEDQHWITYDQGKSWTGFKMPGLASRGDPLSFHWTDSKRILFHSHEMCSACVDKTYYTTDGFATFGVLHQRRRYCNWAKSTDQFTSGDENVDKNRVICIVEGRFSPLSKDFKLVVTDNFFKTEHEPTMSDGRTVSGMSNMAVVKGFIVAAAKARTSAELALYVSKEGMIWHRAEFGGHKIEEEAYTILESTNYSIQVGVTTSRDAQSGILFTSNSNGTYFTRNVEHINHNVYGFIDFEKIQNIQGIYLVNAVSNWEEVDRPRAHVMKRLKSSITFDDGRTFEGLKAGSEDLHLQSVTNQRNSGRIFSSPAPGIVMGVGNTGSYLKDYAQGDLYVSDTAGKTWTKALDGPHKYEFGDQGSILVAVPEGETDKVSYSINHGRDWNSVTLKDKMSPYELTTVPDSTSLKFILVATKGDQWYTVALNFEGLHERKCGKADFDDHWYARTNDKGEALCVMGQKQWFRRRKADADCFVDDEFKEPLPQSEPCDCTDDDFECDYNFVRTEDRKGCEIRGRILDPKGQCKSPQDHFDGSSGWRLIPGNLCKRARGEQKDDPKRRPCDEVLGAPASGKIDVTIQDFTGIAFASMYYLERDPKAEGTDETIVMITNEGKLYKTHDHGKKWTTVVDEKIVGIYPHQYNNDHVYFITPTKKVWYSKDRAEVVHSFETPDIPNINHLPVLSFHQSNPDWLLWIGDQGCSDFGSRQCHTVAHVSRKNGLDWESLLPWVRRCQFMYREGRDRSEDLIYCERFQAENPKGQLELLSTTDFFNKDSNILFDDIVDFATMEEFIVVAAKTDDHQWLKAHASVDGHTFAHAAFPPNFQVEHERAYTVLDSSTNAVFLHVTTSGARDREFGSILKSNSNGTNYVLSIPNVNRNTEGYVDFEKMQGLEGVAMVNVVTNPDEVRKGANKKVKSMITHDDGSDWGYLPPPAEQLDGRPYDCVGKGLENCSLHLHSYTERKDPRDAFSSPSAVGLMVGVGNVGETLGHFNEGDTFLTNDGGLTWKPIMAGIHLWEYGDQGSIIVLVQPDTPTKEIYYSTDEGSTWPKIEFSSEPMLVDRITTVPSDNSRNFLLWGRIGSRLTTVNLDFTGLTNTPCKLDKEHVKDESSDYYLWSPKHPLKEDEPDCLFGHKAEYYRKKTDRNCYNGPMIERLHDIERNCFCTRQDFECDYNFERQSDGNCKLVPDLKPADPMDVCKADPNTFEYYDITGYRKIPLSTCEGGRDLVKWAAISHPCPGKEKEYQEKKGLSGAGLFFAIIIPIIAAAGVGYWVWTKWDGKFGRIRLGDGGAPISGDSPWIAWPVAAVAAVVAVVAAIPLLVGSIWRSASSGLGFGRSGGSYYGGRTYNSRSSFARGRGDYAVVDNDEGELLGEDSDEEV